MVKSDKQEIESDSDASRLTPTPQPFSRNLFGRQIDAPSAPIILELPSLDEYNDNLSNFLNNEDNVFWGASKIAQKARVDPNIRHYSNKFIKKYVSSRYAGQRYKPLDKNYKKKRYKKTSAHTIGFLQMDIADLRSITPSDQDEQYLLVLVDIFSRKAYLLPLETRERNEIREKLQLFFGYWYEDVGIPEDWSYYQDFDADDEEINKAPHQYINQVDHNVNLRRIKSISCDREFATPYFINFLKKQYIQLFSAQPNDKGATSLVERVIQTIRGMIGRWITRTGRNDWFNIIDNLDKSYNNTKHRSIGVAPNWAFNHLDKFTPLTKSERQELEKWKQDPAGYEPPEPTEYVKVDDLVRINEHPTAFHRKKHRPVWSHQIYKVVERIKNRYLVRPVDNNGAFTGPIKKRKRRNPDGSDLETDVNTDENELFASYNLLVIKHQPSDQPDNNIWTNIRQQNDERRLNRRMAELDTDIEHLSEVDSVSDVRKTRDTEIERYDPHKEREKARHIRLNKRLTLEKEREEADRGDSDLASYATSKTSSVQSTMNAQFPANFDFSFLNGPDISGGVDELNDIQARRRPVRRRGGPRFRYTPY